MPAVYHHRLVVAESDLDDFGHANNLSVLRWTLAAAEGHCEAQGWPTARLRDERGAVWVVRQHRIRYLRAASLGDEVVVQTWVGDMRRMASLRHYKLTCAGEVIARGETDWAYVALDARGQARPLDVPEDVAAAFEVVGRRR